MWPLTICFLVGEISGTLSEPNPLGRTDPPHLR
nr:MAG TPA: CRM1 / Exportin repeat 3 [Caudoviricetes sp.]